MPRLSLRRPYSSIAKSKNYILTISQIDTGRLALNGRSRWKGGPRLWSNYGQTIDVSLFYYVYLIWRSDWYTHCSNVKLLLASRRISCCTCHHVWTTVKSDIMARFDCFPFSSPESLSLVWIHSSSQILSSLFVASKCPRGTVSSERIGKKRSPRGWPIESARPQFEKSWQIAGRQSWLITLVVFRSFHFSGSFALFSGEVVRRALTVVQVH